jgi:hypothetical protein
VDDGKLKVVGDGATGGGEEGLQLQGSVGRHS